MENIKLKIEKLIYEGYGLAHHNGKAVFIKSVLPDEEVEIKIVSKNKNYLRGEIVQIIEPSKHRIKPICPLSKPCGGCNLNFVEYDYLVEQKQNILKEIFQNFENLEIKPFIKSEIPLHYRCKIQYPISQTKKSKRFLIGYYKEKSHEIVNIKFCPAAPLITDEIINFTRENWQHTGYIESSHKGLLRHISIRYSNHTKEILLTFVLNSDENEFKNIKKEIENFATLIMEKFPQIKGFFVNLNPTKTNKITGEKYILIKGANCIIEKLEDKIYKIGADSFFQINPPVAEKLFSSAKNLIDKKGPLLDLYGGVGAIGIFMKENVTKITLVEENKEAIKLAKENFKLNEIQKYEIFETKANLKMEEFIKQKKTFANIIIDPPRKGSDPITLKNVASMTNSIIYISCNPTTLKRDSEILIENGFKLKSIQGADMFPYTHHIETLAHFVKGDV